MIAAADVPRHVAPDQERTDLMLLSGTWTAHVVIRPEHIRMALPAVDPIHEVVLSVNIEK